MLRTEVSSEPCYSLSISATSLDEALRLHSFLLICVRDMPSFKICFFLVASEVCYSVFSYKKLNGRPLTKYVECCYTRILSWEMKPPLSEILPVWSFIVGLIAFISHSWMLLPFNGFSHMSTYRQTNVHSVQ